MEHGSCVPQGTEIVRAGFHYTLSLIGGKYKMAILYLLAAHRHLFSPIESKEGLIIGTAIVSQCRFKWGKQLSECIVVSAVWTVRIRRHI